MNDNIINFKPTEGYKILSLTPIVISIFLTVFLGYYFHKIIYVLSFILGIICYMKYMILSSIFYKLNDKYIEMKTGLFSKDINYIKLERIIDIEIKIPFIFSFVNVFFLHIHSVDKTNPHYVLKGINDKSLANIINEKVDLARKKGKIYETI